jgi:hypothetical protein
MLECKNMIKKGDYSLISSKSSFPAPQTGHSFGGSGVLSSVSHPQTVHRHRGIIILLRITLMTFLFLMNLKVLLLKPINSIHFDFSSHSVIFFLDS